LDGGDTPGRKRSVGKSAAPALGRTEIDLLAEHMEDDSMGWTVSGSGEEMVIVLAVKVLIDSNSWGANMGGSIFLAAARGDAFRAALLKVMDFNRRGIVGGRTNRHWFGTALDSLSSVIHSIRDTPSPLTLLSIS
jgi:hypothetical protein